MNKVPSTSDRPNFLLFMTDQQRADHLGAYGNTRLRSPEIDALADKGVVFEHMYTNAPVCMPSRACIATGRMPSATGSRMNGIPLSLESQTFIEYLRLAGYRTALVGKAHFQNMTENDPTPVERQQQVGRNLQATSDRRDGSSYQCESPKSWEDPSFVMPSPYYGFEDALLCLEHGDEVGGAFLRWFVNLGLCDSIAPGFEHALPTERPVVAPQAWRTCLSREQYPTAFIAEQTIEWLRGHASDSPTKPFFLQCSFPDPHHPFTPPEPFWSMYDPDEITLPPSFHAPLDEALPHKSAIHRELAEGCRKTGGSRVIGVHEDEARQAIALNYGAITMIDEYIGKVLSTLDDLGLSKNTVVIFMSDHGDYMGDHGLLFKGPLHYQSLVRIPFIWSDCDSSIEPCRNASVVSAMDIAPTILERAGVPLPLGMQGNSLFELIHQNHIRPDGCALIEEESHRNVPGLPPMPKVRTLVTERWRLSIFAEVTWGELYDLVNDPHELQNLFDDPRYSEIQAALIFRLATEMIRLAPNLPLASKMA